MNIKWPILLLLTTLSLPTWGVSQDVLEESLYFDFQKSILDESSSQKGMTGFTRFEQGLFVDALWDLVEEKSPQAIQKLDTLPNFYFSLYERLRLDILRMKYNRASALSADLAGELEYFLRSPQEDLKIIYTIAAYEEELMKAGHDTIVDLAKMHEEYFHVADDSERKKELTKDVISDIFFNNPDTTTYMNGEYVKSVKLFMFCRSNRLFPCLFTMKDIHGEVVRNADGSIWNQPSLASSARGLPSYVRNGNTPAGVYTIDSVMPSADQQVSFGKYRRMILNFIPKAKNETHHLALLPPSSHNEEWWRPGIAGRDVGRNLFRIHGTGKINPDSTVPYFPFMRTSGCIAQRENKYDDVVFSDQRLLLDQIMTAMDMKPAYENEPKIKGVLYLIEVDDQDAPVTTETLLTYGIE